MHENYRKDILNYVNKYISGKNYVAGMIINPELSKSTQAETFFKSSNDK